MRLKAVSLFLLCAMPLALFSQSATKPEEATPTELQIEKLKRTAAQVELLQAQYKIQEYQKAVAPILAEQEEVFAAACAAVGVPKEAIKTDCGLNLGSTGPDGKVTPPKVWKLKPQSLEVKP